MIAHSTDTITLAEGHAIERARVYRKRKILDDISISAMLGKSSILASVKASQSLLNRDHFGGTTTSYVYRAAVSRKDWTVADQVVLDTLAQNRAAYTRLLDAEEWMHAFSERLCAEGEIAHAAYRWMDPPELDSYLGGTFESKEEDNYTRRGFKALSMNPTLNFLLRGVMMTVPLNRDMRRCLKCVRYTALPRQIRVEDERIADEKSGGNAKEAEVRVHDGTPVPAGTIFTVQQGVPVDRSVIARLNEMYAAKY